MLDQLIIGDKFSFDDFGASVAEEKISQPPKKEIKETIPFSNVTYDFSKINGEIYWEQRELEYVFEIIGVTPEDLTRKKTAFANWIMNVFEENIISPYDPDFHYVGTYKDMSPDDDESKEKSTITVKFAAYPFKIANRPKEYTFIIPALSEITATILNDSSHRITPTLTVDKNITLTLGNLSFSISAGEITDGDFKIDTGVNTVVLNSQNTTDSTLTVRFYEEVF